MTGFAVIGCGTIGRIRAQLSREYPGISWLVHEPTLKSLAADTSADLATTDVDELLARPRWAR